MPMWLRGLLAFISLLGGGVCFVIILMPLIDYSAWNHKPTKQEKEEVRALNKEQAKLRKANKWDEANAISPQILAIKKSGKDNPRRERFFSGLIASLGGVCFSLLFAFLFFIISQRHTFYEHFVSSFRIFGWPLVLAACLYWLNLFPTKGKDSPIIWYAVIIYAGTFLGRAYLAKHIVAEDGILYIITAAFSILVCVVHWLIHRNDGQD